MRLSSDFGMAIHMLLIISDYSKTQKVTSYVIADILGTHPNIVKEQLTVLKKAGFIFVANRKEKAGTTMARPLENITLFDIFKAVEPNYMKALHEPSIRLSNRCHAGILTNEIISGYVDAVINSITKEFEKITLADTLADLIKKEKERGVETPRELFLEFQRSPNIPLA